MKRDRSEHLDELEKVFRGLLLVFLVLFSLPVFVSFLILAAAVLTPAHTSTGTIFPLDSHCATLLSIWFRISLIPGVALLVYSVVNRLRHRPLGTPTGFRRIFPLVFGCLCLRSFPAILPQQS